MELECLSSVIVFAYFHHSNINLTDGIITTKFGLACACHSLDSLFVFIPVSDWKRNWTIFVLRFSQSSGMLVEPVELVF